MRAIGPLGLVAWMWLFCSANAEEILLQPVAKVVRDTTPGQKGGSAQRIRVQMISSYRLANVQSVSSYPTLSVETFTILVDPSRPNPRDFLFGGKQACLPNLQYLRATALPATTYCPTLELAEARLQEVIGDYLKPFIIPEDRFPAVSVAEGQEGQVNLSNVRQLLPGDQAGSCTAYVSFLAQNGDPIAPPKLASVPAEQTVSVPAPSHVGLMRVIVGLTDIEDTKKACALRSSIEIIDANSKRATFAMAGSSCVGAASCSGR